MKKILLIVIIISCFMYFTKDKTDLEKDAIRFRVIANSDSYKDIKMKENVVREISPILFNDFSNKEDARTKISHSINEIDNKIDNMFNKQDYDLPYNVNYGYNYFPEKQYGNQKFSEGKYESLVISIGEGKGTNYWCILYPPLCMVDDEHKKVTYKSRIVEFIKKIL